MKALVKLDLNKLSAREKTALATNVGDAILNNGPTFPACPVDGLDLMDYADSVRDAITAAQAAKATYHTLIQKQQDMLKSSRRGDAVGCENEKGNHEEQAPSNDDLFRRRRFVQRLRLCHHEHRRRRAKDIPRRSP